jgi:hypothetical protein
MDRDDAFSLDIRIAKRAAMMAGRYAHAKQFNRHRCRPCRGTG